MFLYLAHCCISYNCVFSSEFNEGIFYSFKSATVQLEEQPSCSDSYSVDSAQSHQSRTVIVCVCVWVGGGGGGYLRLPSPFICESHGL